MRKQFIDNLRWMTVFLLIPYHAAQAFNTWGELNFICFAPNKVLSSFIVFFSPFYAAVVSSGRHEQPICAEEANVWSVYC
ncbi:MAG: hypothetical protein IKS10_02200 [Lachnospiraceae bacterium]|nr:hypothetical protein [Lachnospiraceae bacterium]